MKTKKDRNKRVKTELKANQSPTIWDEDWLGEDSVPTLPVLRLCPTAWAKLVYFRDKSPNEVSLLDVIEAVDGPLMSHGQDLGGARGALGVQLDHALAV